MTLVEDIIVKPLGRVEYSASFEAMRAFTGARTASTPDELWVLEHSPVYTLGQRAHRAPITTSIPVVQADRGGDITYHGPGQAVVYTLVDLARRGLRVREFVALLEQAVIDLVGSRAERKKGAPGVYVDGAKIAALGIRVARGRAYHGVALNVDMDLTPFHAIDPCGYPGLAVTQLRELGFRDSAAAAGERLAAHLGRRLEHA